MIPSSLPLDDILESLDLSRAEPGIGLLRSLFARFNARVPFETASKIERDAAVTDPLEKPRAPGIFWRDHLERGAGGTCFARVAAFDALLESLGFTTQKIVGRVREEFDHAALLVDVGGRRSICDVGFPLPTLLPAEEGESETPLGAVRVSRTSRGFRVELGGVPEGPRRFELFSAPVAEEEYWDHWRRTFRPDSTFLAAVSLHRHLENRVVSFARGLIRVDDLHSRLVVPVAAPRAARLSEIFEIDAELLSLAFARVGDPAPERPDTTLTAYLETRVDPEEAFSAISDASGYRRLMEGVAEIVAEEQAPPGWLLRLRAPGSGGESDRAGLLEERVTPDVAAHALRIERQAASTRTESFFRVEERLGNTYLIREARLSGAREDLLRNDSLRGRLAGSLAVDLLSWARLLGRSPS